MIDGNFKPGFKIRLHKKDMSISLETGKELGITLGGTAQAAAQMDAAIAQGNAELDHSALFLVLNQEK
jgi:2-hydroxy-3-oxopropionate reductase